MNMAYCVEITRRRKHFPCCYQSIETGMIIIKFERVQRYIGNAMRTQTVRWVSPQLFRVLFQLLNSQLWTHSLHLMCPWVPCCVSCQAMPCWWSAEKPGWCKRKLGKSLLFVQIAWVVNSSWDLKKKNKKHWNMLSQGEYRYLLSSWGCIKRN